MEYKPFKYEFKIDRENKTISFGGMVFQEPRMLTTADVMAAYGFRRKASKAEFQEFNNKYGITAVKLRKKLNATVREMWINPIEKEVKRYGFSCSAKVNARSVKRIWSNCSKIQEVQKDGLDNLEPFAAILGKSPKEMKEIVGKSLWKRLCKNSRTRNTHIAKYLTSSYTLDLKGTLEILDKMPSTLLKKGRESPVLFTKTGLWQLGQFRSISEVLRENRLKLHRMRMICNDTRTMANQLGTAFSYNWSWEKMRQKHDEYRELVNRKRYSKDQFEWLVDFPVKELSSGEFTATLLTSAYDIHEEGVKMHHCVASYAELVREGEYLVYSIQKAGQRYSTLGVKVNAVSDGHKSYIFSQHYGPCNQEVEDKEAIQLVTYVINMLNTSQETSQ